jgi:hypothetical protein
MTTKTSRAIIQLLWLASTIPAMSGEFINLDFEQGYQSTEMIAGPSPDGSGLVHREWWLPGWRYGDSFHEDSYSVAFNLSWFGASDGGTLYGSGYRADVPFFGNLAILGFRSVSGVTFVHIEQKGLIPADAKSMWYDCVNGPWEVTLNGIKLDLYDPHRVTKPEMEFREIGVDVTQWAGKEVELRLTQMPGWWFNAVDNIRFSAEAIPEPKHATLLLMGWVALWVMSRR